MRLDWSNWWSYFHHQTQIWYIFNDILHLKVRGISFYSLYWNEPPDEHAKIMVNNGSYGFPEEQVDSLTVLCLKKKENKKESFCDTDVLLTHGAWRFAAVISISPVLVSALLTLPTLVSVWTLLLTPCFFGLLRQMRLLLRPFCCSLFWSAQQISFASFTVTPMIFMSVSIISMILVSPSPANLLILKPNAWKLQINKWRSFF